MKYALIAGLVISMSLAACGKKEEASAPAEQATPPAPAAEAPAQSAAPVTEAKAFDAAATYTSTCASCHGDKGQGMATFPKLAGLSTDDIKTKLTDYKAGKTVGPQTAVMAPNAAKLSDSDIDSMATYIAATFK